MITFNTVGDKKKTSDYFYHNKDRETPVALFTGLYLYNKTRKAGLIDKMYQLGLSVS